MTWDDVVALVNEQAEDPGLWRTSLAEALGPGVAEPNSRAYIQAALRNLHRAVEAAAKTSGTPAE